MLLQVLLDLMHGLAGNVSLGAHVKAYIAAGGLDPIDFGRSEEQYVLISFHRYSIVSGGSLRDLVPEFRQLLPQILYARGLVSSNSQECLVETLTVHCL